MDNKDSYINQGYPKNIDNKIVINSLENLQKSLNYELIGLKKFVEEHQDIEVLTKKDKTVLNIENDINWKHYFKTFAIFIHLAIINIILVKHRWH